VKDEGMNRQFSLKGETMVKAFIVLIIGLLVFGITGLLLEAFKKT
jgi:hypothetical protein